MKTATDNYCKHKLKYFYWLQLSQWKAVEILSRELKFNSGTQQIIAKFL